MLTRRGLFGSLLGMVALPSTEHQHTFQKSPYYVMAAGGYEEAGGYYPPSKMVGIELCVCGAMRINPEMAAPFVGKRDLQGDKYK